MEWEGVRHSFCLGRVWSSRLLWPMYPFYACYEWHVAHVDKTKSHIYLWMHPLLCLKNFRSVLVIKKIWFWFIKKIKYVFVNLKKKKRFWRENSDLGLLNKTKSFGFKKKEYQICFWELEKLVFGLY